MLVRTYLNIELNIEGLKACQNEPLEDQPFIFSLQGDLFSTLFLLNRATNSPLESGIEPASLSACLSVLVKLLAYSC